MRVYEHVEVEGVRRALAAGLSALGLWFGQAWAVSAQQPSTLSGAWRAGSTQIEVALESWGEDCGPRPQSSRSAGGGIINIEQTAGQLVIHGRGQDIRSDACWSRNPSMKRQSASFANNVWTTKCRTSPNDPREEQGTYTLRITGPDTLTYQDVSRYNWALKDSRCAATFTTIQTLSRKGAADPKPVATKPPPVERSTPPPEPEEKETACTPGEPARMALRPRKAEIEVGQRVCFKARVVDNADCVVKDQSVQWSLSHSKALRGTLLNGCFTAADTAAEAEGEFKIMAALGQIRAEAIVAVHPVDLSALIAKRLGGGALTGFDEAAAPLEAAPKSVTRVATRREPEPSATSPRKLIGIALGIAATALALAALWLSRRKPASETVTATPIPSVGVRPAIATAGDVPSRRAEVATGPTAITVDDPPRNEAKPVASVPSSVPPPLPPRAQAPHNRAEVAPTPPPPAQAAPAKTIIHSGAAPTAAPLVSVAQESKRPISSGAPPSGEAWICPKCRVGYPAQQQTCPKDGTPLMPYSEFAQRRRRSEEERTKRCPRCGQKFPAHAAFCAEDGTPLVDA